MKTYVLVASADSTADSAIMAQLSATRYRSIPAMRDAVAQAIGAFGNNDWSYYSIECFREKWNDSTVLDNVFSSGESYIAFLEVEHDE
jgi:hypothetical protein|nr:MAG TPA: hypothetical protein [Bacteriophage sp.]